MGPSVNITRFRALRFALCQLWSSGLPCRASWPTSSLQVTVERAVADGAEAVFFVEVFNPDDYVTHKYL